MKDSNPKGIEKTSQASEKSKKGQKVKFLLKSHFHQKQRTDLSGTLSAPVVENQPLDLHSCICQMKDGKHRGHNKVIHTHFQLTFWDFLVDQVVLSRETVLSHCQVRVEGEREDASG